MFPVSLPTFDVVVGLLPEWYLARAGYNESVNE